MLVKQLAEKNTYNNLHYYCGDEQNVLKRVYQASVKHKSNNIIRINADCPFVDYRIIDSIILKHKYSDIKYDFVSTKLTNRSLPYGLDIELFTSEYLKKLFEKKLSNYHCENVTTYMLDDKKSKKTSLQIPFNFSDVRMVIDTIDDYFNMCKLEDALEDYESIHIIDYINKVKKSI